MKMPQHAQLKGKTIVSDEAKKVSRFGCFEDG